VTEETQFCLLGPLAVRRHGVVVPVTAGKQQALLAALLLRAGRPVGTDDLVETLWGPSPPPSARASLHNYVTRLRKALEDDGTQRIVTEPGGYCIRVGHGELDVSRFAAALAAGRDAARARLWADAATVLREGLSLWRGDPLSGVPSDVLAVREVPRLAEMRLQAVEARIDADLHLGRHADVIAELRQLIAADPLRERLHVLLMTALYRDGQQAGALAAYQGARNALIRELGTEPGPGLRQLQQRILTSDPSLAIPHRDSGHDRPPAVAAPAQPAAGAAWPAVRRQLPTPLAQFAGRGDELAVLTRLLGRAGMEPPGTVLISAIDGMPGAGKTALAVQAGHLLAGRFPGGQLFVDLRGHTPGQQPAGPADVLAGLLAADGADPRSLPAGLDGRAAMWRDRLAGQRVLLILDNAASSAQVTPLLPGTPGCLVLITSRRYLGDLPSAAEVSLDVLPASDAQAMFTGLAPRAASEPGAVAELVALCGHLPLAIALLARLFTRHRSWTMAHLITETRARLLTVTVENHTVAAAFEVSYQHLDAGLRRFFRYLGLHPGPDIDARSAAALTALPLEQAAGHLDVLHSFRLLSEPVPRRYRMHNLIRQYARGLAAAEGGTDRAEALSRLADCHRDTAPLSARPLACHELA
jgi:DNA-binding SARP family transcriptional activator